jgi:hypothetical protein
MFNIVRGRDAEIAEFIVSFYFLPKGQKIRNDISSRFAKSSFTRVSGYKNQKYLSQRTLRLERSGR